MPQGRRLLNWFRERKLIQVLAIYIAASWAILEVTDVFIDKLGLPAWFFPAAIILLLIGFAVVTTTAIVEYGAPAAGAEAAKAGPRLGDFPLFTWPRAILGGVAAFVALAIVGAVWVVTRTSTEAPVVESPNAVAVLPFRASGSGLEVWREGLMDVLAANLDGVGDLRAVDTRTIMSRWSGRIGDADAPAEAAIGVAAELGARWAVYGQAVELGPQIRLDARFFDTRTGELVTSSSTAGAADSILALLETTTLELLRGLGQGQGLGDRGQAMTSTSLEAVKSYLEGEQAMRRSEWAAASEAFERALEIDSTFAMAAARLSQAYGWRFSAGHPSVVEAAARAFRLADRLPARERGLLELNHLIEQGRLEAIDRARQLTARYPDDPELWYQLGETYYHLGSGRNIADVEVAKPFERALALDSAFLAPIIHLTELTAALGDMEGFDRYARIYLARDSTSDQAGQQRIAHALARGPEGDSLRAIAELQELSTRGLWQVVLALRDPSWHDAVTLAVDELTSERHTTADRSNALYFWRNLIETRRGRASVAQAGLRAAQELTPDLASVWLWQLANLVHGLGDPALAEKTIERGRELGAFEIPIGRWLLAAYELRNGAADRVVAAHADTLNLLAEDLRAAGDSLAASRAAGLALGLRGLQAAARADYPEAVSTLRRSIPQSFALSGSAWVAVDDQRMALASALAELGEEGEALRILESGFRWHAYWDVPAALFRAQLYERRGERQNAIRNYSYVVELYRICDPELVPQRELAERALERLTAEL